MSPPTGHEGLARPRSMGVAIVLAWMLGSSACADTATTATTSTSTSTSTSAAPDSSSTDGGAGDSTSSTPPSSGTSVRLNEVATLDQPLAFVARPTTDTMYAAEKEGRVWALERGADGFERADTPLLDLTDAVGEAPGERGLLGLAFSPDGAAVFVNYTDGNDDGATVIERWTLTSATSDEVDTGSRVEVLRQEQPFANHNGGNLVVGPDGFLYVGFGDGGGQGDPDDNSQDLSTMLGKLIRIDLDDLEAEPQIVALGLRNPWRFSFDRSTGDLWIGDVGGSEWEEVDRLPADQLLAITSGAAEPANFGWSLREGRHDTDKAGERPADFIDPVAEYSHDEGVSVTGGFVVRDPALPALDGTYLYTDFANPEIRWIEGTSEGRLTTNGATASSIASFGEDNDGMIYLVSLDGPILRLEPDAG